MGNYVTHSDRQDFSNFVKQLSFSDVTWIGEFFTWKNKQVGENKIWSRLDRALENFEWMMN